MTPTLYLLLCTLVLAFVEIAVAAAAANTQVGLPVLAGNREGMAALTGFAGRARRAYLNMLETLPIFIALVLLAHIVGRETGATLFGAHLFFWGRVAHWLIYLAGIPWLRTLAWAVSVVGLIVIFVALL